MFPLALVAQTLLAAGICLARIGDRPFWQDEVASVSVAARSPAAIFDVLGDTDANMGLYYLVLHAWMWLGSGEGWVRTLSAVSATATVPLTVLLARRLFGERVAVVAGFVLAPNVLLLAYAQEARSYALGLFLSTLSTWLFVRAIDNRSRRTLGAYVGVSSLAVYANLFGALVIAAQLASLPLIPRRSQRPLLAAQVVVAALTAPLALFLLAGDRDQVSWVPAPGLRTLVDFAYDLAGSRLIALILTIFVVLGLVRLARAWPDRDRRWNTVLVVAWLFGPPVALFLVSFATPLFVSRYVIGSLPALAILAALGITTIRAPLWSAAAFGALLLLSLSVWTPNRAAAVEDLRAAGRLVARATRPGDGIAYVPAWTRVGVDYYLRRSAAKAAPLPFDLALAPDGSAEAAGDLYATEAGAATVAGRLVRHRRVWVASYPGSDWHPTPEPMIEAGTDVLARRFRLVRSRRFGQVQVALFVRRTS